MGQRRGAKKAGGTRPIHPLSLWEGRGEGSPSGARSPGMNSQTRSECDRSRSCGARRPTICPGNCAAPLSPTPPADTGAASATRQEVRRTPNADTGKASATRGELNPHQKRDDGRWSIRDWFSPRAG